MLRVFCLYAAVCFWFTGSLAAAQRPTDNAASLAAGLLARGVEARRLGHDDEALSLFEQAAILAPSGELTAQIGLAEQALGRWVDASAHLVAALESADPFVQRHRATLLASLEEVRNHLGTLEVLVNVDSADLLIRGARTTTLPSQPIVLPIGRVEIEVQKPGYRAVHREVIIRARLLTRESIELFAEDTRGDTRSEPQGEQQRSGDPRVFETPPEDPPPLGRTRQEPHVRPRLGVLFWTGVAVSAAGGITAGALALAGNSEVSDYRRSCTQNPLGAADAARCEERRQEVQSSLDGYETGIYVSLAALGVGAVLATIDALTPGGEEASTEGPTIAVSANSLLIGYSGSY